MFVLMPFQDSKAKKKIISFLSFINVACPNVGVIGKKAISVR